jgi:acyl-CoA thioesterase-1
VATIYVRNLQTLRLSARHTLTSALCGALLLGWSAPLAPAYAATGEETQAQVLSRSAGRVVLVVGDSLSAEYGLARNAGWVKLLGDRLAEQVTRQAAKSAQSPKAVNGAQTASEYSVVNASISGETTSGGRTRLPALLRQYQPAVVVIELGANDGLRGLSLPALRDNLRAMIRAGRAARARVLLIGIQIPPNYGREYADRLVAVYAELAREENVALVPFLLAGFADQLDMFQADRVHPTAQAQPKMLANVWPHLRPLLAAQGQ